MLYFTPILSAGRLRQAYRIYKYCLWRYDTEGGEADYSQSTRLQLENPPTVMNKTTVSCKKNSLGIINMWIKLRKKMLAMWGQLSGEGDIYYIYGPDTLPAPLSQEDEAKAFERLEQDDNEAKQLLIVHNLRLVVYIARKFESSNVGVEDLISIGTIGLIKAVNTFSPSRGIKLATYASRCIENEILMFLRKFQSQRFEVSIDEPLNIDWDGNELLLSDVLGTDQDCINRPIEQAIEKRILLDTVERLGDRERRIMQLRFGLLDGHSKTQKEVADIIGISQSYISRLEKRIVKRLKKELERIS